MRGLAVDVKAELHQQAQAVRTAFLGGQGEEFSRVTLTPPCLNRAAQTVFLVAGAGKARILRSIVEGAPEAAPLPARLIRPTDGELVWLVDRAAAGLLRQER